MHDINLIPLYNKDQKRKIAPYMQWTSKFLQTLNRDVFALAEYINVFQTPWVGYKTSAVFSSGKSALKVLDKDNPELKRNVEDIGHNPIYVLSTIKDAQQWLHTANKEGFLEKTGKQFFVKMGGVVGLLLHELSFREYVINEDIENWIVLNNNTIYNHSIIGYYVSLCQTTPIDSAKMRLEYGTADKYLAIPFSNGSYYTMINPSSDRRQYTWKTKPEATDILGFSNIISFHYWPCRWYYQERVQPTQGCLVYNWTGDLQAKVKDAAGIMWTNPNETVLSEFYYDNEEIIMDSQWTIKQSKLQNTTQMSYNIIMENETPKEVGSARLYWEVF